MQRPYTFFHHSGSRALRVGDWKVASAPEEMDRWQLYDLKTDRSEQHDLAKDKPELLANMTARWEALLAQFVKDAH
jgi:arylsulfatase